MAAKETNATAVPAKAASQTPPEWKKPDDAISILRRIELTLASIEDRLDTFESTLDSIEDRVLDVLNCCGVDESGERIDREDDSWGV